jgi:guanylate kinase
VFAEFLQEVILKNKAFVLSGPSAVGKGTLAKLVVNEVPDLHLAVSFTTRSPRPGELDGVHYHFISVDEFKSMKARGEFIESALVHGNFYGTSAKGLEIQLQKNHVLLEIDYQGAFQVKSKLPDAVTIFLLPPSKDELMSRLIGRGTESAEKIAERMENATNEMLQAKIFDYWMVNDNLEYAIRDLKQLFEDVIEYGISSPVLYRNDKVLSRVLAAA